METLPMVAWDRRRYLFVPRPCRKKSLSRAIYGFVPQVSNDGAKILQASAMRACSRIAERR